MLCGGKVCAVSNQATVTLGTVQEACCVILDGGRGNAYDSNVDVQNELILADFESQVDLSSDLSDWANMDKNEKHFISTVLAFFASSDGIVMENLAHRWVLSLRMLMSVVLNTQTLVDFAKKCNCQKPDVSMGSRLRWKAFTKKCTQSF